MAGYVFDTGVDQAIFETSSEITRRKSGVTCCLRVDTLLIPIIDSLKVFNLAQFHR